MVRHKIITLYGFLACAMITVKSIFGIINVLKELFSHKTASTQFRVNFLLITGG